MKKCQHPKCLGGALDPLYLASIFVKSLEGITFQLDEEMAADDDEREALQEIINNTKLSEGYLTLARDIEVMEAKSPEDIYKAGTS
ncbi:hypothetical protein LOK49_LG12G00360 [Camellia lanceoleosa]|uniref:Uncharacterized protein n=1 Tax=Camellia lanceoleosa TaxID=1840588 RepID=A0ACC0FRK0_9ERIC|nr:hypothetical protein LOK49_LG12G00360 [Camellia lanceoleosa]